MSFILWGLMEGTKVKFEGLGCRTDVRLPSLPQGPASPILRDENYLGIRGIVRFPTLLQFLPNGLDRFRPEWASPLNSCLGPRVVDPARFEVQGSHGKIAAIRIAESSVVRNGERPSAQDISLTQRLVRPTVRSNRICPESS